MADMKRLRAHRSGQLDKPVLPIPRFTHWLLLETLESPGSLAEAGDSVPYLKATARAST